MKAKVLLLFPIVLCYMTSIYGQRQNGYASFFGKDSTSWTVATEYYDMPPYDHTLHARKDTIIDNKTYKKIEAEILTTFLHGNYDEDYSFYLREDTTTGRLWCRFLEEDQDFIIADMSLTIGDTIQLRSNLDIRGRWYTYTATVSDTFTRDGHYIIKLNSLYHYESYPLEFIEGVGCSNLADCMRYSLSFISYMGCCHKDGELFYHPNYLKEDNCIFNKGVIGINNKSKDVTQIQVWPNPSTDWININNSEKIKSIHIYDIAGRLLLKDDSNTDKAYIASFPKGIYILHIETANATLKTKIVKQ